MAEIKIEMSKYGVWASRKDGWVWKRMPVGEALALIADKADEQARREPRDV